jgi:dihydrofolate synthase / folylpolyglutamate synthase
LNGDAPRDYPQVQEALFALKARGVSFGIDRMRSFAATLGHPERAVPVIHVAGTNGKGSVSAMVAAILRAAGRRTGLYTSPHLVRLGERVQVDGVALSEAEIVAYTRELMPLAERLEAAKPDWGPSFFEFMTAMAFLQFARRGCAAAVIEVGLGGRLDATNIVTSEVSVITSIALDHCELLGHTLTEIAREKAGIIKPGAPVVIGRLPAEAEAVVRAVAAGCGAPLTSVREVFGDDFSAYPETALEGDYQRANAATATLVARVVAAKFGLTDAHIAAGLAAVSWPGRWQRTRLADGRLLVLDASHNPEGAAVLDGLLVRLVAETGRRPVAITGVLGTARARPLLAALARHAREIHLVRPQQERASTFDELEALVPAEFGEAGGRLARGTVEALFPRPGVCAAGGADDVLVVTGSIYLLGEVLARLEPERGAGEGRLQDF